MSRLEGEYLLLPFSGRDIRLLRKLLKYEFAATGRYLLPLLCLLPVSYTHLPPERGPFFACRRSSCGAGGVCSPL